MKHKPFYLFTLLLVFSSLFGFGQSIPNGISSASYTEFVNPTPPPALGPVSYTKTYTPIAPVIDEASVVLKPVEAVSISTQYTDGLGRPLQIVEKQSSPLKNDAVIPMVYDQQGRERFSYLPYVSPSNSGLFKVNAFSEQKIFMQANPSATGEIYYYSKNIFDNSALNRVVENQSPGNSWVGSNRGIKKIIETNKTTDYVVSWNILQTAGSIPTFSAYYNPDQLVKIITTDENGGKIIEYKDKSDRIILRKTKLADQPSENHTGWLCTYYVYDILGQLRFVITPKAVDIISVNWVIPQNIADELCYRYEYDRAGNNIIKKMPGVAEAYMVYDNRNLQVLAQDGNQRIAGKWFYIKYDKLRRVISTGLWTNNGTQASHETNAAQYADYPFTVAPTVLYPNINNEIEELTQTFYDNYSYPGSKPFEPSWIGLPQAGDNLYAEDNQKSDHTIGLVTGKKTKVLGQNSFLTTTYYYDNKERVVQTLEDNFSGGVDINTSLYNFQGLVLSTYYHHTNPTATPQQVNILTKSLYDHAGRLLRQWKNINNTGEKLVVSNSYDELGKLTAKRLGRKSPAGPGEDPIETVNYAYNIRGWLQSINKNFLGENPAEPDHYFGEAIFYDRGFSDASQTLQGIQYNGNVAGVTWKGKGDGKDRAYGYSYDHLNRLKKADFTQFTASSWNTSAGIDFSVHGAPEHSGHISYDANGNILSLFQKGVKINSSTYIDKLRYGYSSNGNKSLWVNDEIAGSPTLKVADFTDGANGYSSNDYWYDANGNIVRDDNKEIKNTAASGTQAPMQGITYNNLNLPEHIVIDGKGTITYIYDATGNRLRKTVVETAPVPGTKIINYISGFVYENNQLKYFLHDEGKVKYKPATQANPEAFIFEYFIKDHTGSVRSVLTEEKEETVYPIATLEPGKIAFEKTIYDIVDNQLSLKSDVPGLTDYYNSNGFGNVPRDISHEGTYSSTVYRLKSTEAKAGLGVTLKVMQGDKIDVFGVSYYPYANSGGTAANDPLPLLSILDGFLGNGTPGHITSVHGPVSSTQINTTPGVGLIQTMLSNQNTESNAAPTVPKAYINYLFFDEQFKCTKSGFSKVGAAGIVKDDHFQDLQNLTAPANGYIYVYCSNESPVPVYFDNLQLVHKKSALVSEEHYYPFGLHMEGISSSAFLADNKFKYNGKQLENAEFSDGEGLEWYDFAARMYDVQTGRWNSFDPKAEAMRRWSPYVYAFNNPIRFIDPDGMMPYDNNGKANLTAYFQSMSPVAADRQKKITDEQKAFNAMLNVIYEKLGPTAEKIMEVKDMVEGFIPFVDAAKEASDGNFATAALYAGMDIFGGSLERGTAKVAVKATEKFIAKQVEKTVIKGADEVIGAAAKEGLTNAELISQAAVRAERAVGGTGRFAGTEKHTYATTFLQKYQGIYGNRGLKVNQYFPDMGHGKGFLDVRDVQNGAIYDFKFGNPVMKTSQFNKYNNTFGLPIYIVDRFGNINLR